MLEEGGGSGVRMSDIAKMAKVSRQAVYLHFPGRAELLVATTRYLDEVHDIQSKLTASRQAPTGALRLAAWTDFWGNYIPIIYGTAKALLEMRETDEAAKLAWAGRMDAMREGCAAAIAAIKADGVLAPVYTEKEAVDLLWTLLSVRTWEHLRLDCGWPQDAYMTHIKRIAANSLVLNGGDKPA